MKIRLYQPKDAPQLVRLLHEFLKYTQTHYSEQTKWFTQAIKSKEKAYVQDYVRRFTRKKKSRLLLAEENGKVIAYILGSIQTNNFERDKIRGYVDSIFVSKDFRDRKLGKQLYLELTAWLKERGCKQLILEVAEGNPAIDIYEKWGFKRTRQEMRKRL